MTDANAAAIVGGIVADITGPMSNDGAPVAPAAEVGLVLVHATPLGSAPRAFVFEKGTVLLGRDPPAGGWKIEQSAVSRIHASLALSRDGSLTLRDLGSRNGTFVNGERLEKERVVCEGDLVRTGDALFKVARSDAQAHAAYPFESDETDGSKTFGLVGGLAMARVAQSIRLVAGGDATVLVLGETGVGKDIVARAIHAASKRRGRFAAVNCAAIPENLVESELFGYERGAFTGALRAHEGLVRSAEGGTLFLDEIGDMPIESQAKLLRLLESREVLPVGATRALTVDIRIVCATHADLPARVRQGTFRADLYARIAQRTLHVPPLRARKEDIYPIVWSIVRTKHRATPSFGFISLLAHYDWPFNVRELVSAVEHTCEAASGRELRTNDLPEEIRKARLPGPVADAAQAAPSSARRKGPSEAELRGLLAREHGNVSAVARALARDPAQVYRWLKQWELDLDEFR